MDKKKILIVCSILIILASIGTSIYIVSTKEEEPVFTIDGINPPENREILKDTQVENLKITNISLLSREETANYKATVYNDTKETINIEKLYVIFYENKKETKTIALYNETIEPNQEKHLNITFEKDMSKTTKIEYIIEQ